MNKQIIEIEVPEGKKAIWKDGKVVFEDIVPKLPESWEEFCELYPIKGKEYYITSNGTIEEMGDYRRLAKIDKTLLPSIEAAEAHLALMQLHQLRDCYRQGWVPDWNNQKTIKVCIVQRYVRKYEIEPRDAFYPAFLSFQSKEIAEKFLKNFRDLIEQVGDLIYK